MRKISLIGANLDTGNMGVSALIIGALSCVRSAWPDAEISFLDYDDRPKTFTCRLNGDVITVEMIAIGFSRKFYRRNNIAMLIALSLALRIFPFSFLRERMMKTNACLKHLGGVDLALSICGGDSFSDIYGTGRFIYIALPLLWALSMKKKLMLLPQTIGPFKGRFAVALASFIMKRSEMVYARDRESFELARRLMGASHETKANFCYDMGFVLNPIKPESGMWADAKAPTSNSPLVGLNVSGLLSMGGYDRNNMFSLNVDYTDLIRSLISYLIEEKRTGVLLIPHVFGAWQESDVAAVNRLYGELAGRYPAGLFAVQGAFDQHEIKYIIGRCDFFIGSRMHACIAALSQGIPAVGIAYSRKFDGVMKTVGVESLIADPRRSTKAEILRSIGRAFDEREKWAALLRGKMPEVVSTVLGLLREVPARP